MANNEKVTYFFTTKDILKALKARGLPSTWAQIKWYREANLVPEINKVVLFHRDDSPTQKGERKGTVISKKEMPIFTQDDIDLLVAAVIKIREDRERARDEEGF